MVTGSKVSNATAVAVGTVARGASVRGAACPRCKGYVPRSGVTHPCYTPMPVAAGYSGLVGAGYICGKAAGTAHPKPAVHTANSAQATTCGISLGATNPKGHLTYGLQWVPVAVLVGKLVACNKCQPAKPQG